MIMRKGLCNGGYTAESCDFPPRLNVTCDNDRSY